MITIEQFAKKYDLNPDSLAERAAIIEFDGGERRKNAELMAIAEVMKQEKPYIRYIEWLEIWTGGRA